MVQYADSQLVLRGPRPLDEAREACPHEPLALARMLATRSTSQESLA